MKHFTLLLLFFCPLFLGAQLWTEDFDGSNTTNPAAFNMACAADNNDYFGLICVNGGSCDNPISADFALTNDSGQFFGVRDMDSTPCGNDPGNGGINQPAELLSFSAIDISSCGGANVVYVCFSAAESRNMGDAAGNEWGTSNAREDTWDGNSYVFVQSSIDGSALSDVTAIQAFGNSDTRPGIDVNCDGKADDAGEPELTDAFTSYCFELPSFGASLDLVFTFGELNTGGEDVHLDDIEVHCTDNPASLPGTLLAACTPFDPGVGGITFYTEDFDGGNTGSPFVIDANCGINDSRDYFGVVCLDGGPCGSDDINTDYNYNNATGSFFGARDTDNACGGTAFGTISATGIDISGCNDQVYLCLDVAESNSAAENSGDGSFDSWDGNSSVYIYTTFDGVTELVLAGLQSSDGGNSVPSWDTGCNAGGGEGDLVTDAFTTYCFVLEPNGASTVDISIEVDGLNTGGEDIAIDNITLSCTSNSSLLPGTVLPACNISRQTLPVELTYFTGETQPKGSSLLNWETAVEVNNDYFDLEYSTNGTTFTPLTRVAGAGNSTGPAQYAFEHETPLGNLNYYRLKQVDYDGAFAYSDVVVLNGTENTSGSNVFPNPATDQLIYRGTEAQLFIYDALGKQVQQVATGQSGQPIDISNLRPGAYLLRVIKADDSQEVKRFVKR